MPEQFKTRDRAAAAAIISVFETSSPRPKPDAIATYSDGPGHVKQLTFGAHQMTDGSNSLDKIVDRTLLLAESGSFPWIKALRAKVKLLAANTTKSLVQIANDEEFKKALIESAHTKEGQLAQAQIYDEEYVQKAVNACVGSGWTQPLSLAVVLDSMTHGSWRLIRDMIEPGLSEKEWIMAYLIRRMNWLRHHPNQLLKKTATRPFALLGLASGDKADELIEAHRQLDQQTISQLLSEGNWQLKAPILVHMGSKRGEITISESDLLY